MTLFIVIMIVIVLTIIMVVYYKRRPAYWYYDRWRKKDYFERSCVHIQKVLLSCENGDELVTTLRWAKEAFNRMTEPLLRSYDLATYLKLSKLFILRHEMYINHPYEQKIKEFYEKEQSKDKQTNIEN